MGMGRGSTCGWKRKQRAYISPMSSLYLPCNSPISPIYLPYFSPIISPLYLPYISPISPPAAGSGSGAPVSPLCLPYISNISLECNRSRSLALTLCLILTHTLTCGWKRK
jgi:hypothetical protein